MAGPEWPGTFPSSTDGDPTHVPRTPRAATRLAGAPPSWREIEARNALAFRDENEWIRGMAEGCGDAASVHVFVCECGDAACREPIRLSGGEYAAVRASATQFAVAPNHENPETEAVVSECARFTVVQQVAGWGLRLARASQPSEGFNRG